MAVGEAITNLCRRAGGVARREVKLSANWMAAAGHPGEDALLFDAVKAVGMELCPELDISIPVGKDSLSMQAQWPGSDGSARRSRCRRCRWSSPRSRRVADVRAQLTPLLARDVDSELWLIGLGAGAAAHGRQRCWRSATDAAFAGDAASACPTSTIRSACARSSN